MSVFFVCFFVVAMDIIQDDYRNESRHIELLSAHCSTADIGPARRGIGNLFSLIKFGRNIHPNITHS